MANKRYYTYGYTPDGKRVDMYVQDGRAYLSDGTRLPYGYTVQTKAGIYKMGDSGGYSVSQHNMPTLAPPTIDKNNPLFRNLTFQPTKNYSQLAQNMYKPIYDAKVTAIRNRLNLDKQALSSQIDATNRMYDKQVQEQNRMTDISKSNYSNETLNRGLGRSTIATTGLASMDMANQRMVNDINEVRNSALQNIHGRIQALSENAHAELFDLESNRALEEQNLAWQLEDRDRSHWLQEAQINAPMYQDILRRQWDIDDKMYNNAMGQYMYDMNLERELAGLRDGTPENILSTKLWQQELDRNRQKAMEEFDIWAENELKKYTPGTLAYKAEQARLAQAKEMMKYEASLRPQSSGYSGYGGYSRGSQSKSSSGYTNDDYTAYNQAITALNYINSNPELSTVQKISQLEQLERDMQSDLVYKDTVNPNMQKEIQQRIIAEKDKLYKKLYGQYNQVYRSVRKQDSKPKQDNKPKQSAISRFLKWLNDGATPTPGSWKK